VAKLSIVKARLEKEVNGYVLLSGGEAAIIDAASRRRSLRPAGRGDAQWILATHGHPGTSPARMP